MVVVAVVVAIVVKVVASAAEIALAIVFAIAITCARIFVFLHFYQIKKKFPVLGSEPGMLS